MAFVLKQTNTAEIQISGADPQSVTLPGGYTTVAGDCIIVALTCSGTVTFTASGCGATWDIIQVGTGPTAGILVGYGCTGGGTTISIAGMSGQVGDIIVSIWGGVLASSNPVTGSQSATSGSTHVGSETTPSLSYSAGQLVVGSGHTGGAGFGFAFGTPSVWSDGATNTNVDIENGGVSGRPVRLDYELPGSNSSTTYQAIIAIGGPPLTQTMRVIVAALSGLSGQQVLIV